MIKISRAVVAIFLAATFFSMSDVAQAATGGPCQMPRMKWHSVPNTNVSTSNTAFVNYPNANVAFTQTVAGCVLVRLTVGETSNSLSNDLRFRAILDGQTSSPGLPGEVTTLSYNGATFEFLFPDVPVGDHTVRIQFRSAGGVDVFVSRILLLAQYR